jgi:hypothetical protein
MTRALLRTRALVFGFAASSLLAACDGRQPFQPEARSTNATAQFKSSDAHGMSDAAHTCANGGYANFTTSTGEPFKNTGECVSYAAHGGTLVAVQPPVITNFQQVGLSGCDTGNLVWLYVASFTGGTGVVDGGVGPVTSDVVFGGPDAALTLTVTNSQGVSVSSGLAQLGYTFGCPIDNGGPRSRPSLNAPRKP